MKLTGQVKKSLFLGLFLGVLLGGFIMAGAVFAQSVADSNSTVNQGIQIIKEPLGLPSTDIRTIIANIIRIFLGLLGIIAVVLILYAGYLWMTAGGDDEKIGQSKKIMINAVIGLAIILSSYAIVSFVMSKLIDATNGGFPSHCSNGSFDSGTEEKQDCGGECPPCTSNDGQLPNNVFYVDKLPTGGDVCVRNVKLAIVFNEAVDISTLPGNVTIKNQANEEVNVDWSTPTNNNNIAVFTPKGSCGDTDNGNDCLAPSTEYVLDIVDSNSKNIKNQSGTRSLSCSAGANNGGGCKPVTFKTGDGIDRKGPTVKILDLTPPLISGRTYAVDVNFTDDNGVQNISLYANNKYVGSQSFSNCQKTGTAHLSWGTGSATGNQTLESVGLDYGANSGNDTKVVNLKSAECFDNKNQPVCGNGCGKCAGQTCSKNDDCASGYCEDGFCVNHAQITHVSPLSGATSTFVSLSGYYFGDKIGKVYFSKIYSDAGKKPDKNNLSDWVEASLAGCNTTVWTNNQVVVEVPANAVTGPLMIETAGTIVSSTLVKYFDTTNDNIGQKIDNFVTDGVIRPNLCPISPNSGLPAGDVNLTGKSFGSSQGTVTYGGVFSKINSWTNNVLGSVVPLVDKGPVGVKVFNSNNVGGNSVYFYVNNAVGAGFPLVSEVNPINPKKGEYITISGKNFGDSTGSVFFINSNGNKVAGDLSGFPAECKSNLWQNNQIIVKLPNEVTEEIKYSVQIVTKDNKSSDENGPVVTVKNGTPGPSICKIDPDNGPNKISVSVFGERLSGVPSMYFWKSGASATTIDNRINATINTGISSANKIVVSSVPVGTETGPVVASVSGLMSNQIQFTVNNCLSGSACSGSEQCCANGSQTGVCQPAGKSCVGQVLSTGYVWRFSTKDIPVKLHVVERCDGNTENGKLFPSPSPSVLWNTPGATPYHTKVCRQATTFIEFNRDDVGATNNDSISSANLIVQECEGGVTDTKAMNCIKPTPIVVQIENGNNNSDGSYPVKTVSDEGSYLSLIPNGGQWKDNTWYRVILKKGITAGTDISSTSTLSADKPCDGVADSAYCYVFKTGQEDCIPKEVIISPYEFTTRLLEPIVKIHVLNRVENLYYSGHGLSTQRCIMMDMKGFDWDWNTSNSEYSTVVSGTTTQSQVLVSALQNTVGVSLTNPLDAINISAAAKKNTTTYSGTSPLTIDLSNPEVVSFEPNCLEACTNAQIGVKFNVSMSNKNLSQNPLKLFKCNDENCISVSKIDNTTVTLVESSNNTYFQIIPTSLEKETLYKITVSVSSTNPASNSETLWTAKTLGEPSSSSKPYNKEFTWRFRTKKEACQVDRVEVNPTEYFASSMIDRTVYDAGMFSAPDACSAVGQKLDAGTVGWNWESTKTNVATVVPFRTIGSNPFCTANCIRKGSDVPVASGTSVAGFAVCGNGQVEAGEDCDKPDAKNGCGLNCLRMGNSDKATCGNGIVEVKLGEKCDPANANTKVGCSNTCLNTGSLVSTESKDVNSAICGNGMVGSGEDCDLGIASVVSSTKSSMNCSVNCLHTGTRLSTKWCNENKTEFAGFTSSSYSQFCKQAYSQCGDGEDNPDEDPICDGASGWNSSECDEYCLLKKGDDSKDLADCSTDNTEGCSLTKKQHIGSSLLYSTPSLCGDEKVGIGEDAQCETIDGGFVKTTKSFINPWVLVVGIGGGEVEENSIPKSQITNIKGDIDPATNGGKTKGNSGKFIIECGYLNDSDCKNDFGVANDSCCYARTKLTKVFPGATTTADSFAPVMGSSANICRNTTIEAHFDGVISQPTLNGNVFLARQVAGSCGSAMDVSSKVLSVLGTDENSIWYQKIWQKFVKFFTGMLGGVASAGPNDSWCAYNGTGNAIVIPDAIGHGSRVSISLTEPLTADTNFVVILGSSVKDSRGVRVSGQNKSIFWRFKTGSKICEIDSLTVTPDQYVFSRPGVTTTLWAEAQTTNGVSIQGIPGFYDWDIAWGPYVNDYVFLTSSSAKSNIITSQNRDGEIDIRASANISSNKYTAQKGLVATGRSHIIVFLCENPWPPKDLLLGNGQNIMVFPYEDKVGNNDGVSTTGKFDNSTIPPSSIGTGYFNLSTYYCADNGSTGTYDDLPYMKPAVQVDGSIVSVSSSLKRFLFTGDKAYDNSAIGIQVFPNNDHLSLNQWLKNSQDFGGKNFTGISLQNLKVGGYNAVSDGNNIYVDALNFNYDNSNVDGRLYSNIYLFSISENATAETRAVFDQMIKNLRFNANLTNYGYCGTSMDNPGVDFKCTTDFDCANGLVCSVQTDKLKRDYLRLQDLSTIEKTLINYNSKNKKSPDLTAGSYLNGQTVSTWESSWGLLGTTLEAGSLPVDQINRLGQAGTCASDTSKFCINNSNCVAPDTCVLHSPVDGWSTENNRFSFACNTSSLAYRYIFASSTVGYTVRGRFEGTGLNIINWLPDFFNKFIQDPNHFVMSYGQSGTGICLQNEEISTMQQGYCGDGKLNLNLEEKCDPPGFINYEDGCTGLGGTKKIQTCSAGCKGWVDSTVPCNTFSKCGNNIKEPDEYCDDGELNGTYNHCDNGCQTSGKAFGFCGDGILQDKFEYCETVKKSGVDKCVFAESAGVTFTNPGSTKCFEYSALPNTACKSDCSGPGSWCGDGVVNDKNGEQCEENLKCTIDGKEGVKKCSSCQKQNAVAVGNWGFNSSYSSGTQTKFKDDVGANDFVCTTGLCPSVVDAKYNKGLSFHKGEVNFVKTNPNNKVESNIFSTSVWINPSSNSALTNHRILTNISDNNVNKKGFELNFLNVANPIVNLVINDGNNAGMTISSLSSIPYDQWTNLITVYDGVTAKLYVNGKVESSKNVEYKIGSNQLYLGARYDGQINFEGNIDELSYYNRALSDAEVKDLYNTNWFCSTTEKIAPPNTDPTLGYCGDGSIQPELNEDCDDGTDNGKACIAGYDKSCSYCLDKICKIKIVNASGYCGDGIINGGEVCDTDPVYKIMYAAATSTGTSLSKTPGKAGYKVSNCGEENNTKINLGQLQNDGTIKNWALDSLYTSKKGSKSCINSCTQLVSDCVECGLSDTGVVVSGELVNVLEPRTVPVIPEVTDYAGWKNPLYSEQIPFLDNYNHGSWTNNNVHLTFQSNLPSLDWSKYSVAWNKNALSMFDLTAYPSVDKKALINSDPRCSANDGGEKYYLKFNNDKALSHAVSVNITSAQTVGQYDQILSPIIRLTDYNANTGYTGDNITNIPAQPRHLRVVLSWRGNNLLNAGFLTPNTPILDNMWFSANKKMAYTPFYYASTNTESGIWYHGLSDVESSGLHVIAYTLNLDNLVGNGEYGFFVKSPDLPVQSYFSNDVKVSVYIPENEELNLGDSDKSWRHFSLPAKTFSLGGALGSTNTSAKYWHVFNVKKGSGNATLNNVIDNVGGLNSIRTDLKFSY